MLVIAIALTAWWLWRKGRPTRWLLTVAAAGGAFWFLTALNANVLLLRTPTASRYQYPGAVFVLLIAAELLRGIRVGTRALVPAAAFIEARLVASDEVDRTAADRQLAGAEGIKLQPLPAGSGQGAPASGACQVVNGSASSAATALVPGRYALRTQRLPAASG